MNNERELTLRAAAERFECVIESADFDTGTVTLKMTGKYHVAAGPWVLCRPEVAAAPAEQPRPEPVAIGYVRADGTLCAGCPPISEPDGWRPLYTAPPAAEPSEAVQPAGLALVGYIIGSAEESDRGNEWVDCRATQVGEFNVPVYRVTTAPAAAPSEAITDEMVCAALASLKRTIEPEAWPTTREVQDALEAALRAAAAARMKC